MTGGHGEGPESVGVVESDQMRERGRGLRKGSNEVESVGDGGKKKVQGVRVDQGAKPLG